MTKLKNLWNNFKTQPDVWFFYGFLLTFTLSIRKVIKFYPIAGEFNEYTGIYLYLSDIFLILTILAFCIIVSIKLYNTNSCLSSILPSITSNKAIFKILALFNLWVFISIFWSDNQAIALFRAVKILELSLLFLYASIRIVPHGTLLRHIFQILIFIGFFQAIIGIWQFFVQHSVGLFWLKESLISPTIDGVAKIILNGEKYIRAYGLFPHPNILGGFLLLSIIITWMYSKMFHVEHSTDQAWNILRSERGTIRLLSPFYKGRAGEGFLRIFLGIQLLALILTFSKSAILGLIFSFGYILVPRGTKIKNIFSKLFHVEQFARKAILIIGIILVLGLIIKPDINSLLFKTLDERLPQLNVALEVISNHPLLGVGVGQFVSDMDKNVPRGTFSESWQYQPVHNVFLLIWSELGIVGLILFILFIHKVLKLSTPAKPYILTNIFKSVIIGFLFISLFDHYIWEIQQGQIMLWLVAGLVVGAVNYRNIDPI